MTQEEFNAIPTISEYLVKTLGWAKEQADEWERIMLEIAPEFLAEMVAHVTPMDMPNLQIKYVDFKEEH